MEIEVIFSMSEDIPSGPVALVVFSCLRDWHTSSSVNRMSEIEMSILRLQLFIIESNGGVEVFQQVEKKLFKSSALSMSELASIPLFSRAGIEQESLLNALKAFQRSLLLNLLDDSSWLHVSFW